MNKNWIMIGVIAVLVVAAILVVSSNNSPTSTPIQPAAADSHNHTPAQKPGTTAAAKVVPAYFEEAPSRSTLGPTLAPERFTGLTRDAYRAVREIPVTIAQMPCYCHCDRGMGHKSLYSCFEDDHAAHCAVCVNEALVALRLEKEEKLTAPQIRERIMEQFGNLN